MASRFRQEAEHAFELHQTRKRTVTLPRLKAQHEWGGERTLVQAIMEGQAWENPNGTVSWREDAEDDTTGSGTKWTLNSDKNLKKDEALTVKAALQKLGWAKPSDKSDPKITILSGDKLPRSIVAQVEKARARHNKK